MIYGLYSSAFGGKIEMTRADIIANNLANMDTSGFRKDFISFRERLSESMLKSLPPEMSDKVQNSLTEGPVIYSTNFEKKNSNSKYKETNQPLDLAINGDGYFTVKKDDKVFYTREGDFTLDNDGFVCLPDGQSRLINVEGEEIQLNSTENLNVTREGDIIANGTQLGRIGIVDFADPENLKKIGNSLIEYTGSNEALPAQNLNVQQGFIELSTVNPVEEMRDMIETNRLFEGNMRMMSLQNETLERAANNLARIPS